MKDRRKALWLIIPLAAIVFAAWLIPKRDVFDELGPPEPQDFPESSARRWKVKGNEETARQRIESLLARDGGWRLVTRSEQKVNASWTDVVFYWYRNNELDGDAELQYIPARKPDDRAFFDIYKPVGWNALNRRVSRWWRKHKP
jgi:hypothetical protein